MNEIKYKKPVKRRRKREKLLQGCGFSFLFDEKCVVSTFFSILLNARFEGLQINVGKYEWKIRRRKLSD